MTFSEFGGDLDILRQAYELDIDLDLVMTIILRASAVHNRNALLYLLNSEVHKVLQHGALICGSGTSDVDGSYIYNLLHDNYPPEYLEMLTSMEGKTDSPLSRRWRDTMEPVAFQSGRDDADYPADWVNTFKAFGLRNTAAHGVLDVRHKFGSYFIFSNIPGEVGEKEIFLLNLITPHLHFALMRALANVQDLEELTSSLIKPLTALQKEILHWMTQGKTNWEISQIISMTKNNVKYNIEQILAKLEVRNRAQAVSKAMLLGLLN